MLRYKYNVYLGGKDNTPVKAKTFSALNVITIIPDLSVIS